MGRDPCLEFWERGTTLGDDFGGVSTMRIQEECDFFRWADPEADSDDPHVARMKRKVGALKAKVRDIKWKFNVAAMLGIFGWVVLFLGGLFYFASGGRFNLIRGRELHV
ncbi:uncharacterized protein LOC110274722 [Arachis duranensis]|uniref:Uncharacterized protein LOC110274722 n=1 Tax=Arachis duranensis TaxID=130453 RepID=A0A6P5MJR7_ARADU|nr:uncharacterized protein LOC110274722 [Arachis duranensis]